MASDHRLLKLEKRYEISKQNKLVNIFRYTKKSNRIKRGGIRV